MVICDNFGHRSRCTRSGDIGKGHFLFNAIILDAMNSVDAIATTEELALGGVSSIIMSGIIVDGKRKYLHILLLLIRKEYEGRSQPFSKVSQGSLTKAAH
jgi:hypothetical protein